MTPDEIVVELERLRREAEVLHARQIELSDLYIAQMRQEAKRLQARVGVLENENRDINGAMGALRARLADTEAALSKYQGPGK